MPHTLDQADGVGGECAAEITAAVDDTLTKISRATTNGTKTTPTDSNTDPTRRPGGTVVTTWAAGSGVSGSTP